MLARRSTIQHPLGTTSIELPILVPAFSSKGFPTFKAKGRKKRFSEVTHALELIGPYIEESILISAFDLHNEYLRRPQRFYKGKGLVFIDSGGYELSPDWDSTEPKQGSPTQASQKGTDFKEENYREVLRGLPSDIPFVITNYDWGTKGEPIDDQIRAAQELFNEFPNFLRNFLVKTTSKRQKYLPIDEIIGHVEKFRAFHVIGVTEKELGTNLQDRLKNLADIRDAMDRREISIPIHVWGGLDPVISILYFCAGAEIFDGVSWLRYGYFKGMAIPRDAYIALALGSRTPWRRAEAMRLVNNVSYLESLTTRMKRFVDDEGCNFGVFEEIAPFIEREYKELRTRIPRILGGG